jgi:CRP-like cAMP-binding protein
VPREFCLIVSGRAELRQDGRRIAQLGAGDSLGAAGMLSPSRMRAETVVTTSDTRLLVMRVLGHGLEIPSRRRTAPGP